MNKLVTFLLLVIILLVGGVSYLAGKNQLIKLPKVSTTQESSPSPLASPTPTASKIVKGGGILSFPKYQMTVPSGWQDTRESQGADDEKIILTKGSYQISITQGGFGGAVCLFPGDPDIEGPSARYDSYKEITTNSGDLFRRSWTGNELTSQGFAICHKTQYGWGAPTLYGHIAFITPAAKTRAMIDEMDSILSSLKKI